MREINLAKEQSGSLPLAYWLLNLTQELEKRSKFLVGNLNINLSDKTFRLEAMLFLDRDCFFVGMDGNIVSNVKIERETVLNVVVWSEPTLLTHAEDPTTLVFTYQEIGKERGYVGYFKIGVKPLSNESNVSHLYGSLYKNTEGGGELELIGDAIPEIFFNVFFFNR